MEHHTVGTQKIKSFGVAPLVMCSVRTLNQSTRGFDEQRERGHSTTPHAAKKVISELVGHWQNLEGLPMRCNVGWALG
jgi:hypothetical protein